MHAGLQPHAAGLAVVGRMLPVVVDHDFAINAQARAVVGGNAEGMFALGLHLELAGEAQAELGLVVVEFPLDEISLQRPFAQRRQLREVRQLLPLPGEELELSVRELRPLGDHAHHAVHHHRVTGQRADIRIRTHLVRRLEDQFLLRLRLHQLRRHEHARVVGNPVLRHALRAERPRGLRERESLVGGRLREDEVVRHGVVVHEREPHLRAGRDDEFRGVIFHPRGEGLDGHAKLADDRRRGGSEQTGDNAKERESSRDDFHDRWKEAFTARAAAAACQGRAR